jgi:hypothetical protein
MLHGLDFLFDYNDDVLIGSRTLEEYEQQIRTVLKRCQDYDVAINPPKCIFAANSLNLLGHTIDKDVCPPDPERITAINKWPLPSTKKSL